MEKLKGKNSVFTDYVIDKCFAFDAAGDDCVDPSKTFGCKDDAIDQYEFI